MRSLEDQLLGISHRHRPVLHRSFAGWVFRIIGGVSLAIGTAIVIFFFAVGAGTESGLSTILGTTTFGLWLAGGSLLHGFLLLAFAQLADALVTTARYSKLAHDLQADRVSRADYHAPSALP